MIARERLIELIKEDKNIYFIDYKIKKVITEHNLSLIYNPSLNYEYNIICTNNEPITRFKIIGNELYVFDTELCKLLVQYRLKFEELFETYEEAEEYLKYSNIIREEKLELPTWEEFKNFKKSIIFRVLSKDITEEDDTIFQCYNNGNTIIIYNDFNSSRIFNKPLTKENYNEARDLCVKLFKGDGVQNGNQNKV